ncbi:MFS transporter [Clavibacter sp. MX14-G9D]|uniref:MFS transporter n=1 Tax=Clavibacter sp. MX14-G9D TaxID=3064656 RepID=UPI00293ED490|nr:MFS transporter [Clavibacter sp. MX14-G9D]
MTNTSPIFLPDPDRAVGRARRSPAPHDASDPAFRFPWVGILTLAACVFLSVTSEMLPTGLLSEMSGDLGVEESRVGLLVSVFAIAVVVSSVPLAALTRRVPRHALLLAVLAVFATSNLLTALAPTFELVTATRVLGGLAHGLFWAIVGAYSAHLVPPALIGRAVALTGGGGSLAFVLGVPLGTAAGQAFGWRAAFAGIGVLTLLGMVLVWRFLPAVGRPARDAPPVVAARRPGIRERMSGQGVGGVLFVCLTAMVIMIGQYGFYTYVDPFVTRVMGIPEQQLSAMLFGYGIAGAVGLLLAGTLFPTRPQLGVLLGLAAAGIGVASLALVPGMWALAIPGFLLWGLAFGAIPTLLQTRMLHAAHPAFRDTASSFYTTAFNVGIGGGALVGGALLDGLGIASLPGAYLLVLAVSVVLVVGSAGRAVRVRAAASRPTT